MNNNRYKILVIEDESNINNLLKTLLETNGYQVVPAKTCQSGQILFISHRPDLVILDLGLPDADGMNFLKNIRKDSLTPVIVLSARSNESDKVTALDSGANDYVTKPFDSAELVAEPENTEIDEEREILVILSPVKTSKQIMEGVNREFGINSKANGIITAIPAEKAYKI